jgi:uncharacterized HAD superfamily protein
MKKQLFIILLSALFLVGTGNNIFAQWIAPGLLAKAHKDLRGVTSCLKCHFLTEGLDNAACKSCHEELKKKIKDNKGLHSRVKSDCIACHTDHKGEEYDITSIDEKTFNHSLTGYELKDSHDVTCNNCHKKEDTYLGNSQECLKCHSDVHNKTVPEDCIRCHNYKEWKDYVFDHFKKVEYKLVGKHNDAKCELCHPRNKVKGKTGDKEKEYWVMKLKPIQSETCVDCHYDVHKKQFGGQVCDSCHPLEKDWKDYTFKHESEKYRGYKIEGKHKDVECEKCHERSDIAYSEFDNEKKLSLGKFKPIKSDVCNTCHYDVHNGHFKEQKCDACHSVEKDWKDNIFDHQSEKFSYKLEGKHKDVECVKCHMKNEVTYTEFKIEKKIVLSTYEKIKSEDCTSCHYDVHGEQFKDQKCDACHSVEKDWKDQTFAHESETYQGYKLEGKHEKVECDKCHERGDVIYTEFEKQKIVQVGLFKPLKSEKCGDCHKNKHEGAYKEIEGLLDVTCSECHSVEREFKDRLYKHKDDSKYHKYNYEGAVQESECAACHFCDPNLFTISKCFDQMGMTIPGR